MAVAFVRQAKGAELQELRLKYDNCAPPSVGRPFKNDPQSADFVWFADGEICGGDPLSWITHIVHNRSDTDLIFKWPKAEIWADKFTPLPKGYDRGGPIFVYAIKRIIDLNAPIWYTQSYRHNVPAAVYSAENDAPRKKDFGGNVTKNELVTEIRTAASTKEGIVEVIVKYISAFYLEDKSINTEIYASPNNATVAVARIPDYLGKLAADTHKQTIGLLGDSLKKQGASFTISSLGKLIGKERADYAPKGLLDRHYMAIFNAGGTEPVKFVLPISEGAKNEFDTKRSAIGIASLVVLDTNGAVLGNGRVSLWLPAPRK